MEKIYKIPTHLILLFSSNGIYILWRMHHIVYYLTIQFVWVQEGTFPSEFEGFLQVVSKIKRMVSDIILVCISVDIGNKCYLNQ